MKKQHTRNLRRVLGVILSLALLMTFTPLSGVVSITASADSSPQLTYDSDTRELHLISGDFHSWKTWYTNNVPDYDVLSVTADEGVRFVGNCIWLFSEFSSCESMDLSNVDTSQATGMCGLFRDCPALTSLDLSGWNTGAVTDMDLMFSGCESLTWLDISSFDTANVTDMNSMFQNCKSLVSLDLSGFDTARVEDMNGMFDGCEELIYLDLTGFNTSAVTRMDSMFRDCKNLPALGLSSFDTGNAENMIGMFNGCTSLRTLDIRGFDTRRVIEDKKGGMFSSCDSLCRLTLSPYMAVTEAMQLSNGDDGWGVENDDPESYYIVPECISGSDVFAVIDAPEQVTTIIWRGNMPAKVFTGHSLSLDGDVGLTFYLDGRYAYGGYYVEFEWYYKGEKKTATCYVSSDNRIDDSVGVTCPLTADELTCVVKATLLDEAMEDYPWDVYSAAKFAYRVIDHTDTHASPTAIETGDLRFGTKQAFGGYQVKLYLSFDEGYVPDTITITAKDGTNVDYTLTTEDGETVVTFTMPEQDITVTATSKQILCGDANLDGEVDIRDVTAIQRHLAGYKILTGYALANADTNGDGVVTIEDATHLQMYFAEYDVVLRSIVVS